MDYSLKELMERTGLSRRAINYRDIRPMPNGRYSEDHLEALLAAKVKAAGEAAKVAQMRQARAKTSAAKLVTLRDKLAVLKASVVERDAIHASAKAQAAIANRHVRHLGGQAAGIAKDMNITIEEARSIMKQVGRIAVAELGDVQAEIAKLLATPR